MLTKAQVDEWTEEKEAKGLRGVRSIGNQKACRKYAGKIELLWYKESKGRLLPQKMKFLKTKLIPWQC